MRRRGKFFLRSSSLAHNADFRSRRGKKRSRGKVGTEPCFCFTCRIGPRGDRILISGAEAWSGRAESRPGKGRIVRVSFSSLLRFRFRGDATSAAADLDRGDRAPPALELQQQRQRRRQEDPRAPAATPDTSIAGVLLQDHEAKGGRGRSRRRLLEQQQQQRPSNLDLFASEEESKGQAKENPPSRRLRRAPPAALLGLPLLLRDPADGGER